MPCDPLALRLIIEPNLFHRSSIQSFSAMISSLRRVPIRRGWGSIMSSVNKCGFHALHCMTKATQTRFAHEKRQWLLMANTWLEMIPSDQRIAVDHLRAAIGTQSVEPPVSD